MAYDHISLNADQYSLFLDNTNTEVELKDDVHSSSSEFQVILDPILDLSSLLYIRSIHAQMAVSNLVIDSLPLCFTRLEDIVITVVVSPNITISNQVMNQTTTAIDNGTVARLPFNDLCCAEPQLAIDNINKILHYKVNQFLVYRYSKVFFDLDVFTTNYIHTLSDDDYKLLSHYINFALACRYLLHTALCEYSKVGIDNSLNDKVVFTSTGALSREDETTMLSRSTCLKPVAKREVDQEKQIIDLTGFYTVTLTQNQTRRTLTAIDAIKPRILTWLNELKSIHTTPDHDSNSSPDPAYIRLLTDMTTANKELVNLGLHLRKLLDIQKRITINSIGPSLDKISQNEVITLSLDDNGLKCQFHLNQNAFLYGDTDSIKIEFPSHASYVLGSRTDKNVSTNATIGPLTRTPSTGLPRIPSDNNILSDKQRLPSSVCTMPRIIYVATDAVTAQTRDFWLHSTPYKDFHLIYNQTLDDQGIDHRIICKPGNDTVFYKIQRVNSILERISIKILDENFRLVLFPQKTYTRIALIIKPAPIESY